MKLHSEYIEHFGTWGQQWTANKHQSTTWFICTLNKDYWWCWLTIPGSWFPWRRGTCSTNPGSPHPILPPPLHLQPYVSSSWAPVALIPSSHHPEIMKAFTESWSKATLWCRDSTPIIMWSSNPCSQCLWSRPSRVDPKHGGVWSEMRISLPYLDVWQVNCTLWPALQALWRKCTQYLCITVMTAWVIIMAAAMNIICTPLRCNLGSNSLLLGHLGHLGHLGSNSTIQNGKWLWHTMLMVMTGSCLAMRGCVSSIVMAMSSALMETGVRLMVTWGVAGVGEGAGICSKVGLASSPSMFLFSAVRSTYTEVRGRKIEGFWWSNLRGISSWLLEQSWWWEHTWTCECCWWRGCQQGHIGQNSGNQRSECRWEDSRAHCRVIPESETKFKITWPQLMRLKEHIWQLDPLDIGPIGLPAKCAGSAIG